jgi:hypothetical protein
VSNITIKPTPTNGSNIKVIEFRMLIVLVGFVPLSTEIRVNIIIIMMGAITINAT